MVFTQYEFHYIYGNTSVLSQFSIYLLKNIFSPIAECFDSEFLESNKKILIVKKLQKWIDENFTTILKPIKDNFEDSFTSADIRSVIFNLFNSLGTMPIEDYKFNLENLTIEEKSTISKLGIRLGTRFFYIPNFLKKNAKELKAL